MKILDKIKAWVGIRRFDSDLDVAEKRANKLNTAKGNTVVCSYCGGLLLKSEAGLIYDLTRDSVTYHHEECFQKYEHPNDNKLEWPIPIESEGKTK